MRIIDSKTVTPEIILVTNLIESAPVWDATQKYTSGTIVRQADTHHNYKALSDNTGKRPADTCTGLTPVWSDQGVSNDWAPFDGAIRTRATASAADGSIDMTFDFSRCDAIAVFGLSNASTVGFELYDGTGSAIVSNATSLYNFGISNWWKYFFGKFSYRRDFVQSFPMYAQSKLRMVIHGVGESKSSVGTIIIGQAHEIGNTLYGSEFGSVDWSTYDEGRWGEMTMSPGPIAKTGSIDLHFDTENLDDVVGIVESVSGKLAVFDCNNATTLQAKPFERGIILGRVLSHKTPVEGPVISTMSIEIRGVP